jgi:hypothetical protein
MDRRERNSSFTEAMLVAFGGLRAEIWTALPGRIESFDPAAMTATVQPTIQALWRDPDGSQSWRTMPLCLDVPVIYPGGGGCTITFPLVPGDECLIIFASRCIDAWWQSGGIGVQAEMRMHDLSDGFCLPGPRSQPRALTGIASDALQIRSDDGAAFIEMKTASPHAISVQTAGNVVVDAAEATINCNLVVNGTITATDLTTPTVPSYNVHRHGGVFPGGSNTSPPLPT